MTKEDYCYYEVAKLLKEKGFPFIEHLYMYVNANNRFMTDHSACLTLSKEEYCKQFDELFTPTITHQMAMKWLREVHKISIEIYCIPSYTKGLVIWRYMIRNCETCDEVDYPNGYPAQEYLIFEEAAEAALKYCLTELI